MPEYEVEWKLHGSIFDSSEDPAGGRLAVSYTDSVDTRWDNQIMLGPLINTVDCGAAGGTAANANGFAWSHGMNATKYLYVIRGTKWAKIQLSNMTLISDDTETALAERATGIIYTQSLAGTEMISVGMAATAYRNITTVSGGATDTHSAHDGGTLASIFLDAGGVATEPRVYAANGSDLRLAILNSTYDMDDVVWEDIATIGQSVTPTSLVLDGNAILEGTDAGPYYLQEDSRTFKPMIPEIGTSLNNCKGMKAYTFAGVIIPLSLGTRVAKNVISGYSVGPEVYEGNDSPVAGRLTSFAATLRWAYGVLYNPSQDQSWLVAFRPASPADDWHGHPFSYWTLGKLASGIECEDMQFVDTAGGARTNPTVVGGYDDDIFWVTLGREDREYKDSNYRFASSGTWYGTEMRRVPRMQKRIREVILETADCSATQTVQVKWAVEGGTAADFGAPITSNGFHRVRPPLASKCPVGVRLQPQITLTTGASTASPKVIGSMLVRYELEPLNIKGIP